MPETKHLLFTFDYELFLGAKSGSVEKCLIYPTNLILDLFKKHNITNAIFFVDTTYLMRLSNEKNINCERDFKKIAEQLNAIVSDGHFVFPHIHPHWLNASYDSETNQWILKDFAKYRFHNINDMEKEELFDESIKVLQRILCDKNVRLNGYRAGGWSIQPFSDFKPFFEKHGIKNEFSVLKGFKNLTEAQYFDFTNCAKKNVYQFSDNPCVENLNGNYTQYTISSITPSSSTLLLSKVWNKYLWKTGNRSIGDGLSLEMKDNSVFKEKSENVDSQDKEMVSIELLSAVKMSTYRKFLKNEKYMHFISHPKMLSKHNFKCFDEFLKYASSNYRLQTDYSQMPVN